MIGWFDLLGGDASLLRHKGKAGFQRIEVVALVGLRDRDQRDAPGRSWMVACDFA
jgi:hypothetical protein